MPTHTSFTRRSVLKGSLSTALFTLLPNSTSRAANDKIVIGVMGLGGRGTFLAERFAARADAQIAYLCDADSRRFARAEKVVETTQKKMPKIVQDFRRILDDKSVDVLINATPDHWHALASIMACQAGKDVYVEKPMAHNIWEGRKMIQAARKYNRVVQVGMQSRSAPYISRVVEYIRSGKIGDVHLIRVFNMMQHPKMKLGAEQPVPAGFDYDTWCGPAPKLPYDPNRYWLNFQEYSCGPIAGDAIHQLDLARMLIGDAPYPKTVCHTGGLMVLLDGRNTPDTQVVTYEYDKLTLLLEAALWTPYMKKTPPDIRDSDGLPNWPFNATKIEVLGTNGLIYVGRHGDGWQAFDSDGQQLDFECARQADREHQDNFIQSVKSRQRPNADVEQGHYSTLLCHLANISWKVGNLKLRFDGRTESFVDNTDANTYLKRTYRQPWIIPDSV